MLRNCFPTPVQGRRTFLNEVLSLNAQELRMFRLRACSIGMVLNEVLSLNAQESGLAYFADSHILLPQ